MRRRFELDAGAERGVGWLRLGGAAVVLACAAWMIASDPTPLAWFFVVLLAALGLGWTAAALGARRRATRAGEWFLEIADDGVTVAEHGRRLDVPWSDVTDVDIDEDRLVVVLHTRSGDPVRLHPRYRGIGLHDLGEALRDAHRRATTRNGD